MEFIYLMIMYAHESELPLTHLGIGAAVDIDELFIVVPNAALTMSSQQ